ASIWRFVIQQASSACSANWPKAMVLPRVATPARRPLCCLRCLTRLGRSIAALPTTAATTAAAVLAAALATLVLAAAPAALALTAAPPRPLTAAAPRAAPPPATGPAATATPARPLPAGPAAGTARASLLLRGLLGVLDLGLGRLGRDLGRRL